MKRWTIVTLFMGLAALSLGLTAFLSQAPAVAGIPAAWQEGGEDEGDLPPVFEAGSKLADARVQEYYEIKEVRGEWFRGDHYKIRGDATDLMASNAWVHAPGKGWDWVAYEPEKK